jgi:hypothetical protein
MLASADFPTEVASYYRELAEKAKAEAEAAKRKPKGPGAALAAMILGGLRGA